MELAQMPSNTVFALPQKTSAPTALQTVNLTKNYGNFVALDNVSINVSQGDIYGLVGRNGAGKTTLFKCVMGLTNPSSGQVLLGGEARHLDAHRREMGFMISPSFFPYLNPMENLQYLCRVKGINGAARNREVNRLLDLVGLAGVDKPFKAFSLGMKQRLGIAGALLGSPQMVILDEPINGLDPQGIIDIRKIISEVHATQGTTFIVSSHILAELDLVATKFGFIDHGKLLQEVSHSELHQQTQRTLEIVSDDPARAAQLLQAAGVAPETMEVHVDESAGYPEYTLVLNEGMSRSAEFTNLLVTNGISVSDIHRKETTLEDYFMNLVGE
jgi:ABC-2 type transport system ATP-binding protein